MSEVFTLKQVSSHTSRDDAWFVVHNQVYDVTRFLAEHPGGDSVMLDSAGQDASAAFEDVGHSDEAREALSKLRIGTLKPSGRHRFEEDHPSVPKTTEALLPKNGSTFPGVSIYFGGLVGAFAALGLCLGLTIWSEFS